MFYDILQAMSELKGYIYLIISIMAIISVINKYKRRKCSESTVFWTVLIAILVLGYNYKAAMMEHKTTQATSNKTNPVNNNDKFSLSRLTTTQRMVSDYIQHSKKTIDNDEKLHNILKKYYEKEVYAKEELEKIKSEAENAKILMQNPPDKAENFQKEFFIVADSQIFISNFLINEIGEQPTTEKAEIINKEIEKSNNNKIQETVKILLDSYNMPYEQWEDGTIYYHYTDY